jgi:hypothetical protein
MGRRRFQQAPLVSVLVLMACLLTLVAACGGSTSSPDPDTATATPTDNMELVE